MIATASEYVDFPAIVICDSREGLPYRFEGIRADARQGHKLLRIQTVIKGLPSGDYSLENYEERIAIERKSLSDLFNTIGQERKRFERELQRLASYDFSAIVVEADWQTILMNPPARSQLNVKSLYRSILAFMQRYPVSHWIMCPDRRFAEVTTFRLLERFWRDKTEGRDVAGGFGVWRAKKRAEAELRDLEWLEEVEQEAAQQREGVKS